MVTHVGIINKGKIIFQGTMDDLHAAQQESSFISFETGNIELTNNVLIQNGLHAVINGSRLTIPMINKEKIAAINEQLVQQQIKVYQISTVKNDLESIFIDLVK